MSIISKSLIHVYLQEFPAHTDSVTVVRKQLPTPVAALCLRLYVLETSNGWADLNIEVHGCPAV